MDAEGGTSTVYGPCGQGDAVSNFSVCSLPLPPVALLGRGLGGLPPGAVGGVPFDRLPQAGLEVGVCVGFQPSSVCSLVESMA